MVALAKSAPQTLHHLQFPTRTQPTVARETRCLERRWNCAARVAAKRRALPAGGDLKEDYVLEAAGKDGKPTRVRLSELFTPGMDTLAIYSFMYGPERERACPGCTHFLDSLDGAMRHIRERVNFVVVAKSPLERILAFAHERGWRWLRLLSTAPTTATTSATRRA